MTTTAVNIAEKLMAVRLNCSFSWGHKTDRQITAETNSAKQTTALRVHKDLLPGPAGDTLRALKDVLAKFYHYHKKVTMEGLSDGERLLPVAFLLDYTDEFNRTQTLVDQAFAELVDTYPQRVAMAPGLLNAAYNPADYPPATELKRYLNFQKRTLPLPDAGTLLNTVGDSIKSDVDSFLSEAVKVAFADVHGRVKKALDNMVEVLGKPDGRVHDTLINNLVELVSFIPEFNITGDDSLTLLADEIKTKLLIYSTSDLKDRAVRMNVADEAAAILRKMGV